MKNFAERLKGGHPNSLGNTVEIVAEVLQNTDLFEELFNCYFSDDEVVRLRVSNAMKRIAKENKALLIPYIDRFIGEIANIQQASAQWTLAQLFETLEQELSPSQIDAARNIMQKNLSNHDDWIVLNTCMDTLGKWAKNDAELKQWLIPNLSRLSLDKRKSVAGRAKKVMLQLG